MRERLARGLLLSSLGLTALLAVGTMHAEQPVAMNIPAPALTGIDEWINTKPFMLKDLKGQVVVVHFWTFG